MLKSLAKEEPVSVNLKVSKSDLALIRAQAKIYTRGNLSAWLRYAAIHHKPVRSEIKE